MGTRIYGWGPLEEGQGLLPNPPTGIVDGDDFSLSLSHQAFCSSFRRREREGLTHDHSVLFFSIKKNKPYHLLSWCPSSCSNCPFPLHCIFSISFFFICCHIPLSLLHAPPSYDFSSFFFLFYFFSI